jgi:hypothetical protein
MAITVRGEPAEAQYTIRSKCREIGAASVRVDYGRVRFAFAAPRGYNQYTGRQGSTLYTIWPDSDSFADIAKAMMESDPYAAIKAFGTALSEGLPVMDESKVA